MGHIKSAAAALLVLLVLVLQVSANAAKPPDLIVILDSAPKGTLVSLLHEGEESPGYYKNFQGAEYFAFDFWEVLQQNNPTEVILLVTNGDETFTLALSEDLLYGYERMVQLHYPSRTVYKGDHAPRSIGLIAARVSLTILIEGLVFLSFRFREKRSWLVFLLVNLVTQVALNILISSINPYRSYHVFDLFFWELAVIGVECFFFKTLLREKGPVIPYVITANLASLILGSYLLGLLPL